MEGLIFGNLRYDRRRRDKLQDTLPDVTQFKQFISHLSLRKMGFKPPSGLATKGKTMNQFVKYLFQQLSVTSTNVKCLKEAKHFRQAKHLRQAKDSGM